MPMDTGTGMKTKANWLVATTGALCYCVAGPAMAQVPGSVITPIATPSGQNVPGAATVPNLGTLQDRPSDEPSTARAWNIVPRVTLTETLTDNIDLTTTDTAERSHFPVVAWHSYRCTNCPPEDVF